MKVSWQYNKYEKEWFASEDHGSNMWIISKHYDLTSEKLKHIGYAVTFAHLQATIQPGDSFQSFTYGNPTPIFYCRYLKEAKAFVQLCLNSKTIPSTACEYKYFPGKYVAQNNLPL